MLLWSADALHESVICFAPLVVRVHMAAAPTSGGRSAWPRAHGLTSQAIDERLTSWTRRLPDRRGRCGFNEIWRSRIATGMTNSSKLEEAQPSKVALHANSFQADGFFLLVDDRFKTHFGSREEADAADAEDALSFSANSGSRRGQRRATLDRVADALRCTPSPLCSTTRRSRRTP